MWTHCIMKFDEPALHSLRFAAVDLNLNLSLQICFVFRRSLNDSVLGSENTIMSVDPDD